MDELSLITLAAAKSYTDEHGGGGGGTNNYNDLSNQPQINGNTLIGNKTASDLGLVAAEAGKGLSENDYTDADKAIVGGVTEALADKADKSAVKNEFIGTLDEWNALTTEQKKAYDTYQIKGDYTEGGGGSDVYTDTEQKVGTWFGLDLYRKSYYFASVTKGAHSLDITNLDKIIKVEGGYIERFVSPSLDYGFVPFPYSNGAFTYDNAIRIEFSITNGTVTFDWGGNHDPLQKDVVMTVYYTKTA